MFEPRLRAALTALYKAAPPAARLDHAERLLAIARRWLGEPQTTGAADLDQEAVEALCLLLPIRDRLLGEFALKSRIEATFAESGWTPLRCRELLRSLERLPDKPRTDGEKIVADADSILGLGTLGFVRHVSLASGEGLGLRDLPNRLRVALSRRLYTPQAHRDAPALREALRAQLEQLERALEAGVG